MEWGWLGRWDRGGVGWAVRRWSWVGVGQGGWMRRGDGWGCGMEGGWVGVDACREVTSLSGSSASQVFSRERERRVLVVYVFHRGPEPGLASSVA